MQNFVSVNSKWHFDIYEEMPECNCSSTAIYTIRCVNYCLQMCLRFLKF